MSHVRFTGWKPGFDKVAMDKLLRRETTLGLAESKRCVDRILDGESVLISVPSSESAARLMAIARSLGALCEPVDDVDAVLDEIDSTTQALRISR